MSNWNQQYPPYPPTTGGFPMPTGNQQAPGYPPNQPGFPPQPQGYPGAQYPPQPGYAPQGYPPQQAGYPAPQPQAYPQSYPGQIPQQQFAGYPHPQQTNAQPYQAPNAAPQYAAYPQAQGYQQPGAYMQQPQYPQAMAQSSGLPADEPTLRPYPAFNPENDAKVLYKAMKGIGTDEKAIIDILASRTLAQRLQIASFYKTLHGKDLIQHLKSELGGKLEDVVLALMTPAELYDAKTLHDCMSGLGTKEDAMVEIILSRTNAELAAIKQAYKTHFKRDLEKDVMGDTSGYFKRILVACLQCNRQENVPVDINQAKADATALVNAGPKKWGTDETAFISIFALRSFPHLRVVFDEIKLATKKDIEQILKGEMSGDLEDSFLTLAKLAKNKHAYFAERLYHSMKGAGTKDSRLIRLVVTRAEKDMGNIRKEFLKMYGKTLESFIADDCSGDYKKILLALVNPGSR